MSDRPFEHAVLEWLEDGSDRTPRPAIDAVLLAIKTTPQERGLRIPGRFITMGTYTRLAAAAAVVIAVGGFALWQLMPSPGGSGGPTVAPTATAPPTTIPTDPEPTTYVPGALTQTFTSGVYGFSLRYPVGWTAQAATEPWAEGDPPLADDPSGDKLEDAALRDHLFLSVVSRPLGGVQLDDWLTSYLAGCTVTAGGPINGAERVLRATDCTDAHGNSLALASSGGRGYVFELRASNDDVELRKLDTAALLDSILATVQLHPEAAVDE